MQTSVVLQKLSFYPEIKSYEKYPKFLTGEPVIDELDLSKIIAKSVDHESGYGWLLDEAMEIADLYRVFLFLCLKYPSEHIVPPREVDDLWHLHILDTRSYIADCEKIFGYYLHHYPYAGLKGASVDHATEECYKSGTIDLLRKHFPELLDGECL